MALPRLLGAPALAVALLLSVVAPAQASPGGWMKPGVPMTDQQHPDPSVVALGPLLYSFGTKHGGSDVPMAWSADLATWTPRTQYPDERAFQGDKHGFTNDTLAHTVPWGYDECKGPCVSKAIWAPGVAFVGDRWLAYHAVRVAAKGRYSSYGRFAVFGTRSVDLSGDYQAFSRKALVTSPARLDPAGVIDPDVYTEPSTGKHYLLYKTEGNLRGRYPTIWSRQLSSTGTAFAKGSKPRKLMTVTPRRWEGTVVENPSMIKVDGKYVLFYSGNEFVSSRYGTGYAVCKGPLGPCSKKTTHKPLLGSVRGAYGPGGADAVTDERGRHLLVHAAYPKVKGRTGVGGRLQRVAQFTMSGDTVKIVTRKVTASPGAGDGVWFGGADAAGAPAFTAVARPVGGTYSPFVADLDGDDLDDVGLYGAWDRPDASLLSRPGRALPTSGGDAEVGQAGTLLPLSGDFDGDGRTDVFWYQPGANPRFQAQLGYPVNDQLWLSTPDGGWDERGHTRPKPTKDTVYAQDASAIPVVGDFDGRPGDEIWWVRPGVGSDERWAWDAVAGRFARSQADVPATGTTSPAVGDLDGDGRDDLLWYTPGTTSARVWWAGSAQGATTVAVPRGTATNGRRPVAGDFDGDGRAEVLWYGRGPVSDVLWTDVPRSGRPAATSAVLQKDGTYQPSVGDFDGDGVDDIHWYG